MNDFMKMKVSEFKNRRVELLQDLELSSGVCFAGSNGVIVDAGHYFVLQFDHGKIYIRGRNNLSKIIKFV